MSDDVFTLTSVPSVQSDELPSVPPSRLRRHQTKEKFFARFRKFERRESEPCRVPRGGKSRLRRSQTAHEAVRLTPGQASARERERLRKKRLAWKQEAADAHDRGEELTEKLAVLLAESGVGTPSKSTSSNSDEESDDSPRHESSGSKAASPRQIPPLQNIQRNAKSRVFQTRSTASEDGVSAFIKKCKELRVHPLGALLNIERDVDLTHYRMGDKTAVAFAAMLAHLNKCERIVLRDNFIRSSGAVAICRAVCAPTSCGTILTHLDLADNKIGQRGCACLAASFPQLEKLTSLCIAGNDLDDHAIRPVLSSLISNTAGPRLEVFDVSDNSIGNSIKGSSLFVEFVQHAPRLETLDVSWNCLGANASEPLAEVIKDHPSLRNVNLSMNNLGSRGGTAIGTSLRQNCILKKLNVSKNRIASDAAMVIADSLLTNECLEELNMSENPIGQSGVRTLVGTMQTSKIRRDIIVDGCSFQVANVRDFDPKKANGNYCLSLEIPYEHAVAQEILTLVRSLAPPASMQVNSDDEDSSSSEEDSDEEGDEEGSEEESDDDVFMPTSRDLSVARLAKVFKSKEDIFDMESHNFEAEAVANQGSLKIQVGKMGKPKTSPKSPNAKMAELDSKTRLSTNRSKSPVAEKSVYGNTEKATQRRRSSVSKRRRLTAQQRGTLTASQYKQLIMRKTVNAKSGGIPGLGKRIDMRKRSFKMINAVFVEMYDKERWCLEHVKFNQKPVANNARSLAWKLPESGTLEFTFNGSKMLQVASNGSKVARDAMRDTGFSAVYRVVRSSIEKSEREALQVVTSSADQNVFYTSTQAIALAELFDALSESRLHAVRYLYTRIVDAEKRDVLMDLLQPAHQAQMQKLMGKISQFNEENATGYYYLDLSKEEEYNIALRLFDINKEQVRKRKKRQCGSLPDLSQHGNWCAFRNLRYHPCRGQNFDELPESIRDDIPEMVRRKAQQMGEKPKPIEFMWDATYKFPRQGVLELDFVVWNRPPKSAASMALRYSSEIGDDDGAFEGIAFGNVYETLKECIRLHRFAEEKLLWLKTVSTAFYFRAEQAFQLAALVSESDFLALLSHSLPGYVRSAYFVEVLVFLFPRVVDLEEFIKSVSTLYPYEQIALRDRLGPRALLDPAKPDGHWQLDLGDPDGNSVAAFMVLNKCMGAGWENESLNGHRFIMPAPWMEEIPSRGTLNLLYTTTAVASEEDMLRIRKTAKQVRKMCLVGDPPRNAIVDLFGSNATVRKAESMMLAHMENWYNEQVQNACNRFAVAVKKCPVRYDKVRVKSSHLRRHRSTVKKKLRRDWIAGRKASYQKLVNLRRRTQMKTLQEAIEEGGMEIPDLENFSEQEASGNEEDLDEGVVSESDDGSDDEVSFGMIKHWSRDQEDAVSKARRDQESLLLFEELGISTLASLSESKGADDSGEEEPAKKAFAHTPEGDEGPTLSADEALYISLMYQIIDMDDSDTLSLDELRHWMPDR